MNKNNHRLIFNASRGCMMAVAETASSCSKSPSATTSTRRKSSKCSKSAKGDRFTLSKVLLAQWIQAQAATIFIVNICVSSLFTTAQSANSVRDARNFVRFSQSQEVGSQITTQGNLSLNAGANINATAANIQSQQSTQLSAAGNVNLTEGLSTRSLQEAQFASTKGFMSSRSFTSRVTEGSTQSIGTNVGGNTVNVTANQDINIKGSSVIADKDATLKAGNNVNIESATNTASNTSFVENKQSGFLSGGGFGISYGKREQSTDQKNQNTTAAASTVGAIGGNVNINAGQTFRQVG
jgi:filamentous hemagglutinin